ncbi:MULTISPECIES: hypothetical protein [Halorhodospira]|uniref:hypothetical protein n=1 Tax=Halorhodospira TaxID=85108 RepID=UPI001EE7FD95|nr:MULTISPECIES: hypothetical protein [Halorhodospira]MCG5529073.1 hypothetical protein [Halorhodospira halophila]MCG5543188.1 hypothetical protein [Halorhodospira sp. 9628]
MSNGKNGPPEKSGRDVAHSVAKAGLSAIPVVGGAAAELFQNIVQPPLERRRAEWMAGLGERLQQLEEAGLDLEDLKENDEFISAAMYASQLALRTHSEEKREALRNALTNIAVGQAPEEAMQHVFLNLVDTLTELHVRILRLFQGPTPPQNMSMGGLSSVLEHNMPEMRGRRDLYDQLWKDLYLRGLVNTDGLHTMMTGQGLAQKRTTGLGDAFLQFISEPT